MGFFTGSVFSESLNMDTTLGVILPQDARYHRGMTPFPEGITARAKPRTLILLHGLTDNWSAWGYRTRLLSYAEEYGVAVVMPEVQRSFYQDMLYGEAYFTYISEELPRLAAQMFNISTAPEDLMVAGLSMGGYGALRCGLLHPDRYRAVGSFSGAVDVEKFVTNIPVRKETANMDRLAKGMFGESLEVPPLAQLRLLAEYAEHLPQRPPIMMTCGRQDALYESNVSFYDCLRDHGLNVTLDAWDGDHEWGFWDRSVRMLLERYA